MGFFRTRNSFINIITNLGLTTNLKLCFDASDSNSYDPVVQTDKWLDTSGNGYDFFRGSGTGGDAADPTFNGTTGGLSASEYWSFDGGDYFTYDTTNEAWMETLHQDNAILTAVGWVQVGALGGNASLFGTTGTLTTGTGCFFRKGGTNFLNFQVRNAGVSVALLTTVQSISEDVWTFVAVSLTEATGAGGAFMAVNDTFESFTST